MKPAPFEYFAAPSVEQALALLAEHGYEAKVLAGGQSLVPMMNFRLVQPSVLVDLNAIPDLGFIQPGTDGGLRLGALTRHHQVEVDPLVAERMPLLHDAMPKIGYPQIRRRGTLGGSLAHADPSAELVAVSVALDGRFRLRSPRGERWLPASDFFVGLFTTVLQPEELLVEVALPALPARTGCSLMEVARRRHDFALMGVAAVVSLDAKGGCQQGRIERETIKGWGYDRYVLKQIGPMAGTLMAVDPSEPNLLRYNSRLPIVVYVPEGVEVRYRIWRAAPDPVPAPKG